MNTFEYFQIENTSTDQRKYIRDTILSEIPWYQRKYGIMDNNSSMGIEPMVYENDL